MVKMQYEKPDMLVEEFVSTQSVVAMCGDMLVNEPLAVVNGEVVCRNINRPIEGEDGTIIDYEKDNGHKVKFSNVAQYDTNPKDGTLYIFSSANNGGCELLFDKDMGNDPLKLGTALTDNSSWGRNDGEANTSHQLFIDGLVISSM